MAGIDRLRDISWRPRTSRSRLSPETEALVCELRRVLERNGLVVPQAQRHKRKYKR